MITSDKMPRNIKNPVPSDPSGTEPAPVGQNTSGTEAFRADDPADEILVGRCKAGNMAAFGCLIEKYQHRLFNAILRIVGNYDDAQELTQEALVRALQAIRRFRGNAGFYTWLFRIGVNLSINHHRRRARVQFTSLHAENELTGTQADGLANLADVAGRSPEEQAHLHDVHQRVLRGLEKLEPDQRALVVLRDIEQLDYADIARVLEVPVGTVKSRLSRSRMALREMLAAAAKSSDVL